MAEQLADEEDPLQIRLRPSLDSRRPGRSGSRTRGRRRKRVHYPDDARVEDVDQGVLKEAIQIPETASRKISGTERFLAAVMMPGDRQRARMHGLVGKPLL